MTINFDYTTSRILPIDPEKTNKVVSPRVEQTDMLSTEFTDSDFTSLRPSGDDGDLTFSSGQTLDLFLDIGFRLYNGRYSLHELGFIISSDSGNNTRSNIKSDYYGSEMSFQARFKIKAKQSSSALDGQYYSIFSYMYLDSEDHLHYASYGVKGNNLSGLIVLRPFNKIGSVSPIDDLFEIVDENDIKVNVLDWINNVSNSLNYSKDSYHLFGQNQYFMQSISYLSSNIDSAIYKAKRELTDYVDESINSAKEELREQYIEYINRALTETSKRFVSR